MKFKTLIISFMLTALIFSGCGNASNETVSLAPVTVTTEAQPENGTRASDSEVALEDLPIDPAYDFDVDSMKASDFGGAFSKTYSCDVSTYTIGDSANTTHTVTVIDGEKSGPSVYIIAGIHGDEEAAWQAGKLLKNVSIKAGTLYVIAPANESGAKAHKRNLAGEDPNRVWPGSASGSDASRNAYYIYQDVKDKDPDFVIDLHEARIIKTDGDTLGSSITYTSLDSWPENLFFNFMSDTQSGKVCSRPFHSDSPSPDGSTNWAITTGLDIPTMTVETFRGYQMDNRISDQLAVVQYVLQYYEMVD